MSEPSSLRRLPVLVLCQDNAGLLEVTCSSLAAGGFRAVHVLAAPMRSWAKHSRSVKSYTILPSGPLHDGQLLEAVAACAARTGARVLLPVQTMDVRFASRHRDLLPGGMVSVPVPDDAPLEEVADKAAFTRLTAGLGLPVPPSLELRAGLTVSEVEASLAYPVLAKNPGTAGGTGITRLSDPAALAGYLAGGAAVSGCLLQQELSGDDLAMTLLCDQGEVFAFNLRRRWFGHRSCGEFGPPVDWEFFECSEIEALGRRWVQSLRFTGIADFDLIFQESPLQAWFLECDPRMMFSQRACAAFGMNVAALMVRRALGERTAEVRAGAGHFLSMHSMGRWLRERGWRQPRRGPLRTGLRGVLADPLPFLFRRLGVGG